MRLMRPSWEGAAAVPGDAPSDAELWARGDEHAFGELYDRYAEAVWNHSYRLDGVLVDGGGPDVGHVPGRAASSPEAARTACR